MNKIKCKLLEVIQIPWILIETGFWAILSTYRGMQIRYLKWKKSRMNKDLEKMEIENKDKSDVN